MVLTRCMILLKCSVLSLLFLTTPTVRAQPYVAYVLDAKGKWSLDRSPNEFVRSGQRLPAKGVLRIQSPAVDDYIVVARLNGQILADLTCSPQQNCERPIALPGDSDSERSAFGIILKAAMELIFGSPKRYSVHRARENVDTLAEAVVRIDKREIDLAGSFRSMPSGSYSLSLRKLSPVSSRSDSIAVSVKWNSDASLRLKNARLGPGLWELRALPANENPYLASSNVAWILLVGKAQFEAKRGQFGESVAGTERWEKSVSPEAKRRVLRACLDQLAASVTR